MTPSKATTEAAEAVPVGITRTLGPGSPPVAGREPAGVCPRRRE